jgi:pilus assembly protein Flp/PilA
MVGVAGAERHKISKNKICKPRRTTMTKLMNLIRDEEGATAIEYGLIAALIAAGIVTATSALGDQVVSTFEFIKTKMSEATVQ